MQHSSFYTGIIDNADRLASVIVGDNTKGLLAVMAFDCTAMVVWISQRQ